MSARNNSSVVQDYINKVIKKSWTWARLTEEERRRFLAMEFFDHIKGTDKTRIEWLHSIYVAYLTALDYKPMEWRE